MPVARASAIAGLLFLAFEIAFGMSSSAKAELKICNQTLNLYNLAIARPSLIIKGDWQTEGWWTVTANSCITPISESLTEVFIYLYATDIYGNPAISGASSLTDWCVKSVKFLIDGQENCWKRGYMKARFSEIDTKGNDSWTVFIQQKVE